MGGGAVLFDILSSYNLDAMYISDINAELINAYRMIRMKEMNLSDCCQSIKMSLFHWKMLSAKNIICQTQTFQRVKINGVSSINLESAAVFIFLNRTCFNGLFRVNRKDSLMYLWEPIRSQLYAMLKIC